MIAKDDATVLGESTRSTNVSTGSNVDDVDGPTMSSPRKTFRYGRRVYGRELANSFTAESTERADKQSRQGGVADKTNDNDENLQRRTVESELLPRGSPAAHSSRRHILQSPTHAETRTSGDLLSPSTPRSSRGRSRSTGTPVRGHPTTAKLQRTAPTTLSESHAPISIYSSLLNSAVETNESDDDDADTVEHDADDAGDDTGAAWAAEPACASGRRFFMARTDMNRTSSNTLASLPPLEKQEFRALLAATRPSHTAETARLAALYRMQFAQWYFEICNGFSLLLYGLGSKRALLQCFALTALTDAPLIIVNGFSPIVSPKEVIDKMASMLPLAARGTGTLQDQARRIIDYLARINATCKKRTAASAISRFYILIHNIEGSGLQSERARTMLAMLAASPHVSIIASIDHIQAGLLWDSASAAQFRWASHDITTFMPYHTETSYECTLLMRSDGLDGRAAHYVLSSLTTNARGLFRLLARQQLSSSSATSESLVHPASGTNTPSDAILPPDMDEADETDVNGNRASAAVLQRQSGLSYSQFYTLAREEFLVSNDLTFRTQLTEFRDHRLMLTRRSTDGEELFYIPLNDTALNNLIQKLSN